MKISPRTSPGTPGPVSRTRLISGQLDIAATGAGEHLNTIEAGELRVLAVTGPQRISGVDAPTLTEAGIDLEVMNWRGLMAPPGLSQEQHAGLLELIGQLRATAEWQTALARHGWQDSYLAGEEFEAFLTGEMARTDEFLSERGSPR